MGTVRGEILFTRNHFFENLEIGSKEMFDLQTNYSFFLVIHILMM